MKRWWRWWLTCGSPLVRKQRGTREYWKTRKGQSKKGLLGALRSLGVALLSKERGGQTWSNIRRRADRKWAGLLTKTLTGCSCWSYRTSIGPNTAGTHIWTSPCPPMNKKKENTSLCFIKIQLFSIVICRIDTYCLELNTFFSVGQLQGKKGPIVTHVVNFMPPTQPINTEPQKGREGKYKNIIPITAEAWSVFSLIRNLLFP